MYHVKKSNKQKNDNYCYELSAGEICVHFKTFRNDLIV